MSGSTSTSVLANLLGLLGPQGVVLVAAITLLFFGGKIIPAWAKGLTGFKRSFQAGRDDKPVNATRRRPKTDSPRM
jgi:Sec-independent protein translocase protein TatA